jgi:hypothetical protein
MTSREQMQSDKLRLINENIDSANSQIQDWNEKINKLEDEIIIVQELCSDLPDDGFITNTQYWIDFNKITIQLFEDEICLLENMKASKGMRPNDLIPWCEKTFMEDVEKIKIIECNMYRRDIIDFHQHMCFLNTLQQKIEHIKRLVYISQYA